MIFEPYVLPNWGYIRLPQIILTPEELKNNNAPENCSNEDFLKILINNGFKRRLEQRPYIKKSIAVYKERSKIELDLIKECGFIAYILLVWRVCNFCDQKNIARGFGRGSVGGSLLCYFLNIVQCDPVKEGLFFERFISKTRAKKIEVNGVILISGELAPDVDIDVEQMRRSEVIQFLEEQYPNRTSKISTLNTLSGRLLIKECGKIIEELPEQEMTEVAALIPKVSGFVADIEDAYETEEKFKKWCDKYPEVYKIALKLRDLNKNTSCHASGITVSFDTLDKFLPLHFGLEKELISSFEMNQVAKLTIKLDVLGLRCCTVISNTAKQVGLDIYKVNVDDDPIIYDNLQELIAPIGIFQLEADTALRVTREVKPKNLSELSDILAIGRPGALAYLDKYVEYKNNPEQIEKVHPIWDKILTTTYNQPLYQEQMMALAHQVFNFTLEEAETLRRAVAKKKPDEVKKWEEKIYTRAKELNLDVDLANRYWKLLDDSSKYSFNRCLSPDTIIETKNGNKMMYECQKGDKIISYDIDNQKDIEVSIQNIYNNSRELFEVEFKDGRTIKCSMDHKFLCSDKKMRSLNKILEENWEIMCKD